MATGRSETLFWNLRAESTEQNQLGYNERPRRGHVVLILVLLVLTSSYAGLWALRFVLEQRTDTE